MKIAILGGTYNPVHIGHIFLAKEVLHYLKIDKIFLIPTNIPMHKDAQRIVSAKLRLEMLNLAVKDERGIFVEDCDIKRGGITYTIDTIKYMREKYSNLEEIYLVIGDDLFESFSKWRDVDELLSETSLVVAKRKYAHKVKSSYPHIYLDNLILPLSSSQLRERIKNNLTIDYLLPDSVIQYIRERKVYS